MDVVLHCFVVADVLGFLVGYTYLHIILIILFGFDWDAGALGSGAV